MRRNGAVGATARRRDDISGFENAITSLMGILATTVPYGAPVAAIALKVVSKLVGSPDRPADLAERSGLLGDAARALPWWLWMAGAAGWLAGPILRADVVAVARAAFEFGLLWWLLSTSTRHPSSMRPLRFGLAFGGFLALVGMAAVSVYQAVAAGMLPVLGSGVALPQLPFGPHPLAFPGRVAGWLGHPNDWGAWAALLGVGMISLQNRRLVATMTFAMATVAVFASGSRSALVALFVGTFLMAWFVPSRTAMPRRLVVIAALLIASWAIFSPYGGRFDLTAIQFGSFTAPPEADTNLFRSSEDVLVDRSVWLRSGVSVAPGERPPEANHDASTPGPLSPEPAVAAEIERPAAIVSLIKDTAAPDARVFQAVTLHPGTTYTLSAELRPGTSAQRPGLAGWGRQDATSEHDSVNAVIVSDTLRASSAGNLAVQASDLRVRDDGWLWVRVTFTFDGPDAITWRVGPTVDQRPSAESIGSRLDVRRIQLVAGDEALAYAPTTLRQRQRRAGFQALVVRLDVYQQAMRAIHTRPLTGWGDVGLATIAPPGSATRTASVGHAHNVVLDAMVRHGLGGLVGIFIVFLALVRVARHVGRAGLALLATLITLNVFDSLFWQLGIVHLCATLLYVGLAGGDRDVVGP